MKKNNSDLILGMLCFLFTGGVATLIGLNFADFIGSPLLLFSAVAMCGLVGIVGGVLLHEHAVNKKESKRSANQLVEIAKNFDLEDSCSLDREDVLQKAIEKGWIHLPEGQKTIENFNPYYFISLLYIFDTQSKVMNFNDSVDLTYKTITEMQRAGYTNEEIAEDLMMEMAEFYDCNKRVESMTNDRVATRELLKKQN